MLEQKNKTQAMASCSKKCKFILSNWKQIHPSNKKFNTIQYNKILTLYTFVKKKHVSDTPPDNV